jgi:hypothetical protein
LLLSLTSALLNQTFLFIFIGAHTNPARKKVMEKVEARTKALNLKAAGSANESETVRLALTLTDVFFKLLVTKLNLEVTKVEIQDAVAETVSLTGKVNITGQTVALTYAEIVKHRR